MRKKFIDNNNFTEVFEKYKQTISWNTTTESIGIENALSRITAEPVFSNCASPFYHSSAMDGIAVNDKITHEASETNYTELVETRDFSYINTGDPLPEQFNAVIMIENIIETDNQSHIKINKSVYPWQNIRTAGEDIKPHEMLLSSNHLIRPIDISLLSSGGVTTINVYQRQKALIITTGSELVPDINQIKKGKIIDSNSHLLGNLMKSYGFEIKLINRLPDDYEKIKNVLLSNLKNFDIIMINAGSACGTKDNTFNLINELGEVLYHGLSIKPGKPAILGHYRHKPFIGIPGYPGSAYIVCENVIKPLYDNFFIKKTTDTTVKAFLMQRLYSTLKADEWIKVILSFKNDRYLAFPLGRGAGSIKGIARCDGWIKINKEIEGIEKNTEVQIKLEKNLDEIKNRLVSIGSHDIILETLENRFNFISIHKGSLAGLYALKEHSSDLAPVHILDPKTNTYNDNAIKELFGENQISLIHVVKRLQGFVYRNDKYNINSFNDIADNKLRFINRQRGAGTRILTDYLLHKLKINNDDITGYKNEVSTHAEVAMAVSSNYADCGIAIQSVAVQFNLNFSPISYEDYEFAIYTKDLKNPEIQKLINHISSIDFQDDCKSFSGYDFSRSGEIRNILLN